MSIDLPPEKLFLLNYELDIHVFVFVFPEKRDNCTFLASERIKKLSELNSFQPIKTRSSNNYLSSNGFKGTVVNLNASL